MKKLFVEEVEVVKTNVPTKFCGFTVLTGQKGFLLYTGNSKGIRAVSSEEGYFKNPNHSYGSEDTNLYSTVEEFISNPIKECGSEIENIYFFDSFKELLAWASE